ncbi:unnamed protein product [Caenorhabditis sp. 36 PRJEB53466]|nr:unnamed protein product [Caenorhabditis sp. 36 PRJEB53466]
MRKEIERKYHHKMRTISIEESDGEDESIFPEEEETGGKLKMAVAATNKRKRRAYARKVYALLTIVFAVYAIGNMVLFITPGVREFIQQYRLVYIFAPLPIVSRLLISSAQFHPLLLIPSFLLHLLAIFLSATSISLTFDTELFYFSCFTIFLNLTHLVLYTLQNCCSLSSLPKTLAFLAVSSSANAFFLQILLVILIHMRRVPFQNRFFASYITRKNYYEIIGVPPTATKQQIRDAFLAKTKQLHPDQSRKTKTDSRVGWATGASETEQFMLVKEAYDVLRRRISDGGDNEDSANVLKSANAQRAEWSADVIPDARKKAKSTVYSHFRNPEEEYLREKRKNRMLGVLGVTVIALVAANILYIRKLHSDRLLKDSRPAIIFILEINFYHSLICAPANPE